MPASPCPRPGSRNRLTPCTDRKSTRLNSSHSQISYAVFCLKKKKKKRELTLLITERRAKADANDGHMGVANHSDAGAQSAHARIEIGSKTTAHDSHVDPSRR